MAALAVGNSAALREQYVAEHKILMKSCNNYLGIKDAGKDLILYVAFNDALAPLNKQYIGFGDLIVLLMINHLCQKTAIKMMTAQKHEYKATGYNNPCDPTTSIPAYFTQLDRFQLSLGNRSIATSDAEKMMVAGAQIRQSEMFTEDQMVAWVDKSASQQTWAKLKTYFTKKWLECKQYSATMAKQSCFKKAVLIAQETAAAEDKGKSQAMLFAMLQEQHDTQIAVMTATNKANMDAMMKRMNTLVTGGAGRCPTHQHKESTPTVGNSLPTLTGSGKTQPKKPKRRKCMCPIAECLFFTNPKTVLNLSQTKTSAGWVGSWSTPSPDKHRGPTK
jgi:hypothetical protein